MALKNVIEVRAVATTNISSLANSPVTIDGVSCNATRPDWVLLVGQTTASQNGIYAIVSSGNWTRPTGAATQEDFYGMTIVCRGEGSQFGHSIWQCINSGTFTVGTDALNFRRITDRRDDWLHTDIESPLEWLHADLAPVELTDGNETITVDSTTHNGYFTVRQGRLTADRTKTLGTTNAQAGSVLVITRADVSANILILKFGATDEIHRIAVPGTVRFVWDTVEAKWKRDRVDDVLGPPHLNVKHFGAKGDGSTDDQAAIKAAADAAKFIPPGSDHIVFPRGTYKTSSSPDIITPTGAGLQFNEGAKLRPSQRNFTIQGRVHAHPHQAIFDLHPTTGATGYHSSVTRVSGSGPMITLANPTGGKPARHMDVQGSDRHRRCGRDGHVSVFAQRRNDMVTRGLHHRFELHLAGDWRDDQLPGRDVHD